VKPPEIVICTILIHFYNSEIPGPGRRQNGRDPGIAIPTSCYRASALI